MGPGKTLVRSSLGSAAHWVPVRVRISRIIKIQEHPVFAWDFMPTVLFMVLPSESLPKPTPLDNQGRLCNSQGHVNTAALLNSCSPSS